ncbi:MAG: Galactose-1-phosphate uridylyltransferase [Candidatus Yanofskybacteria bacterium GW2011_GWA2_41_22]|uniref:Uncharacterized protein n=6 Tax=Parcubacteria group TaxID=1794811 RepID=A0A1F8HTT8_9BACT|nr:MAG: Galactose-1-phosphate uridylyltransferase [Candidatus Yanofskybacteria bacterium GW2011_GWA2_41_22]KKS23626.1 MAG: Galactose-1-phosphate uridylyltransferase [Candidatus Jorgensenbacteria bacterium GW2011_GWF2_41_8]KKS26784.1 MAG: Galactose-1-phosphate uridylyltransferase [Candidatus Yanofskybacteria bacterium GW2011_GWC2_41_9]KKU16403.1 MAG: Galactose-1-phosphate uridylyltransferase [Candidatus Giovannonibacteria bacterium GW2011_GWB1_45_9b]OGM98883.1 MAG: hypothetical protein A2736_029
MIKKFLSEFRQNLVSGEWVLFSAGRAKGHIAKEKEAFYKPKEGCPFDDPVASRQEIVWGFPDNEKWNMMVIQNKYPAVMPGKADEEATEGLFKIHAAAGNHDIIIFREHDITPYDFSKEQFADAIKVYKRRYKEIYEKDGYAEYILIFHNYGPGAGASIYHPHSQIISFPVLPPDVYGSIYGSFDYYKKHGKKIYDIILEWEIKQAKRIVYENEYFIAFCPFVSKYPYEVRIFPKQSHAHFEVLPDEQDKFLGEAIQDVVGKIGRVLDKPFFNYFIHTAPLKDDLGEHFHDFYCWHLEIVPRLSIEGGVELGTDIHINVVDPDDAAEELRGACLLAC